jgi:hypothetical protein
MREILVKKGLVLAIIFLFVSTSIAPSIIAEMSPGNSLTPEKNKPVDGELVQYNVKLCRNNGVENNTIWLTKEQEVNLDAFIEDFKQNLDNSTTMEETIEIFKEAVVSINELGLLPESTNVVEVQKLITNDFSKIAKNNITMDFEKESFNGSNLFCLMAGRTNDTYAIRTIGLLSNRIITFYLNILISLNKLGIITSDVLEKLIEYPLMWFTIFNLYVALFPAISPIKFVNGITIGHLTQEFNGTNTVHLATGWISTFGVLGVKSWSDKMMGKIIYFLTPSVLQGLGVTGFVGLEIQYMDEYYDSHAFYLGFAPLVKIGDSPIE